MRSFSTSSLAEPLELTCRLLHSRGYAADLFPAQWVALRYFSRATMMQRTASELARFQGLANGPVSRTVRTLIQKGLLTKAEEQPKGRAELLELTSAGRAVLERAPTLAVEEVIQELGDAEKACFARSLQVIVQRLALPR